MRRTILLLAVVALLALGAFTCVWTSPPYYGTQAGPCGIPGILSYAQLPDSYPQPYMFQMASDSGVLFFYGSSHTRDPEDRQIADIHRKWAEFHPTVALVEGRLGFLIEGFMNPVFHYGEMGCVNALARDTKVRVFTWELPVEEQVRRILTLYSPEQAALFYILRPYFSNLRFGKPLDPDATVTTYIKDRGSIPGIRGTITSVGDIDSIWERDFAAAPNWRDVSDESGLPGYLRDVASVANNIRNEHLACVIVDLVARGERVFVIGGASHAVAVEQALRTLWDEASSRKSAGVR